MVSATAVSGKVVMTKTVGRTTFERIGKTMQIRDCMMMQMM
ncbi:hypothetical protein MHOL44478_12495 [Mycobacterium holsaticum DSM 44478]|nr:hypothetical protein [Mycolicibacterium holsaticum DSM 44478 = JCM 12374]